MIDSESLAVALEEARTLVRADGADFALKGVDDEGSVELELVLVEANCADCVMPRTILEQIVAGILRKSVPDVSGVSIDDPRESMP